MKPGMIGAFKANSWVRISSLLTLIGLVLLTPVNHAKQAGTAVPAPVQETAAVPQTVPAVPTDPRVLSRQYQARVLELQSQSGAFDPQLAEAMHDLGVAQQQLGDHREAIETFTQSAHIKRINEGLYAVGVLPTLERLIESYAHLGNWEAVDDQHHFIMEVNGNNYGWNDERMLPVLDQLTSWHMYAFFEDITPEPVHNLQMARSLFAAASRVIELNFGQHDLRLAKQLRGRRVADYYLAHVMQEEEQAQQRYERLARMGLSDSDYRFDSGSRAVSQGYLSGLRSSRQVVEIYRNNPDVGPGQLAEAITELGDWYLRFNKRQSAMATYLEAYQMLSASEELIDQRNALFDKPRALDFGVDYTDYLSQSDDGLAQGYVLIELDLSRLGSVQRATFIEEYPEEPSMRRRALRELRGRRFRPRFVDGEPVESQAVRYRYVYWYPAVNAPQPAAMVDRQPAESAAPNEDAANASQVAVAPAAEPTETADDFSQEEQDAD